MDDTIGDSILFRYVDRASARANNIKRIHVDGFYVGALKVFANWRYGETRVWLGGETPADYHFCWFIRSSAATGKRV